MKKKGLLALGVMEEHFLSQSGPFLKKQTGPQKKDLVPVFVFERSMGEVCNTAESPKGHPNIITHGQSFASG